MTPYVHFSIVGVYYFLGTSAYTKRVFLPILYDNNIYTMYTIAIYRYDINDLTPADFSAELLLGFVDIVRQTVVDFGSRIRYG